MNYYKRIIKLGLPILVGQLGLVVVGFADNAMVGHYSTDALAAASFVNNIFNIAILMCIGFAYGLTPLVGALFSRGEDRAIGATLRTGLRLNVAFSLLVTLVMGVIYLNLDNMGQPEHLLPLIRPYFLIYLSGVVAISLFQVFAQTAYAVNSTKMPMWIILGSNAVNVVGNYALIYGQLGMPEMGLTGAGISTLVARWICPIAIMAVFMRGKRYRCYMDGFRTPKGCGESRRKLLKTSLPVSLQMGFETASFSISAVMAGWLGHVELAAFQIIVVVGMLGFTFYYGVAAAVSVLVANAAGAGDREGMRRIAFAGYRILLVMALGASVAFLLFGEPLIRIFTSDPTLIAATMTLIFPLILYQLGNATQVNFANALRGTSHVMPMVWIAFFSYIIVGVPATYLIAFTFGQGIFGIVLSFSVSLFTAGALFLTFFIRNSRS